MQPSAENEKQENLDSVAGSRVEQAQSELTVLAIKLEGGAGLLLEATGDGNNPQVSISMPDASGLPDLPQAVCSVDWSWIYGCRIKEVTSKGSVVKIDFEDAGPVTVTAMVWKGKPFLGFQPYKAKES